ncbi:MAG TPA: M15 family metallopeptidase [Terrimesophilobacter sp.]|nr:M15 family metallopeptidase [Terrimesophilobacter sp.]
MLLVPLRRHVAAIAAVSVVLVLAACAPERVPVESPSPSPAAQLPAPVQKTKSFFDKSRYSIDDPLSIWVVNDKLRPLNPIDYIPPDLVTPNVPYISSPLMRKEAAAALEKLVAAAAAEGAGAIQIQNAYRSFAVQTSVHNRLVAQLGREKAQAQSARPGYSEHQTGLTADLVGSPAVCSIQTCFGDTPQGQWLAKNGWRFGFVIRYPEGKTDVTGYIYEPWHVRYVGTYLSTEMHNTGILTLEEFFGLPPAPDYAD